jgi:hypothetical protein
MVAVKAAAIPIIGEGSTETLSYPCNIGASRESIFHCRDHYCNKERSRLNPANAGDLVFIHGAVPGLKRYENSLSCI